MDNSKSPLLELIREYFDDDNQPIRLYKLLEKAKALVKRCFKYKSNNKYARLELDGFGEECQWAKGWIREENAKNPALSAEEKTRYLKDWTDYIDRIYQWLKSAFQKGKADYIEYKQLENIRDGFFERGSIFYQAEISHYQEETKGLKDEMKQLRNDVRTNSDSKEKSQEQDGQVKMNSQQKSKIKKYGKKLLSLCVGEPLQTHKTSGNGHWESCERDAYNAGEIQDRCRREYRKKILEVLGDDADDWMFITRIYEDLKPNWFSRLDNMRQEILQHTYPDTKQVNWLEPQGGKFGPNKSLRSSIERLANELLQVERDINEEKREIEFQEKDGQGKQDNNTEAYIKKQPKYILIRNWAEKYIKKNANNTPSTKNELLRLVRQHVPDCKGCSPVTLNKAIEGSEILETWERKTKEWAENAKRAKAQPNSLEAEMQPTSDGSGHLYALRDDSISWPDEEADTKDRIEKLCRKPLKELQKKVKGTFFHWIYWTDEVNGGRKRNPDAQWKKLLNNPNFDESDKESLAKLCIAIEDQIPDILSRDPNAKGLFIELCK